MKRPRPLRWIGFVLAVTIGVVGVCNYARPFPVASANATSLSAYIGTPSVTWPNVGEAAMGASGYGVLASTSAQNKLPTASIAKILTAVVILKAKPLAAGEQGPDITITPADVTLYNKYVAENGSVVRVAVGEQLSEYQALQAMLLPSANNVADALAIWAYGSMDAYRAAATNYVSSLGLKNTTAGSDASGFLPDTVSTPSDLVTLGEAALREPVVAEIVGQKSATLPVAGTVTNAASVDLGKDGIIGMKVGNIDQDPGAFLFAARDKIDGQAVTIVGAVMGQPTLHAALDAALPLLASVQTGFARQTPVTAGQALATYTLPNGTAVTATAKTSLSLVSWQGAATLPHLDLQNIAGPLPSGATVGTVTLSAGDVHVSSPVVLTAALPAPTFWQRMLRL